MPEGNNINVLQSLDTWVSESEQMLAALVVLEQLVPVTGEGTVFFPPTFATPRGERQSSGYNIDENDNTSICLVDSVGSQANRMENAFMRPPLDDLVPQIVVNAGENHVNLLAAGHRIADAIVRFSELRPIVDERLAAYRQGNAVPLARLAPTSLLFGAWDSRETNIKIPRLIESVIRAFGVRKLTRSAQYTPAIDYRELGFSEEELSKDAASAMGLAHVPSTGTPGGVIAQEGIKRQTVLNLTALRNLAGGTHEESITLRRYMLGLALSALAVRDHNLRQGCLLTAVPGKPCQAELVYYDGRRENVEIGELFIRKYATAAAEEFGVDAGQVIEFKTDSLKKSLKDASAKNKKARGDGGD
ncbi:MAG: type I-U CRISPR-associated RAMP protein Csb1/Cas7u [Peptococcaceae bacterium]|jgi:CRISPR-associated protein Csb1|nr:type I-U CRISPR-associated RAMP protein Csb1/Cas7u [Peptococcaceae bacterium]